MRYKNILGVIAACVCGLSSLSNAQNARPLAIKNARILTMNSKPIESGTILIKDGRITELGDKVKVPAGAKVVDAGGGTVMPGLVSAWSRAGLGWSGRTVISMPSGFGRRFPRPPRRSSPSNKAGSKVSDTLYARQEIFHDLLKVGVTTLAIAPQGSGLAGLAARINPNANNETDFVVDDASYLVMACAPKTSTKKLIKKALDDGKKALEERKKPKEEPKEDKKKAADKKPAAKPNAEKPGSKPAEKPKGDDKDKPKPGDDPKPKPKPEPKPKPNPKPDEKKPDNKPKAESKPAPKKPKKPKKRDPNAETVADLLDGKQRAFVVAESANQFVHYLAAIDEHRFPMTIVAPSVNSYEGDLDQIADKIAELDAPVLMSPRLTTRIYTDVLRDPSRTLRDAGIKVGYLIGDSQREVRNLFFEMMELVRHGAPAEDVLAGVTSIPAKILGVDREVGTIAKGRFANLLMFDGDPLDPTSTLVEVFYRGEAVEEDTRR